MKKIFRLPKKRTVITLARRMFRNPLFKWISIGYMKDVVESGYGSNECLKKGFLPMAVHFHSPVPDLDDLRRRDIWNRRSSMEGIDFNEKAQMTLLARLGKNYGIECKWPLNPTKDVADFYIDNPSFSYGYAAILHSIIREFKPDRIIEIGSGNSSKIIAKAISLNEKQLAKKCEYTVIDPYPLDHIKNKKIKIDHLDKNNVEETDPGFFDRLGKNDVLFIDSSHMVKIGNDVNYLFLEVLPRLKPGVIVHIHDINLPYEYQRVYAESETFRQFWTEQYLLQALLSGSRDFEVMLGLYYLMTDHSDQFKSAFPHYDPKRHRLISGGFWIRRIGNER